MSETYIIVVDDEPDVRELLCEFLEGQGYRVAEAANAAAFRKMVETEEPDLVLLDVNMPGEDGFSLAKFIHATSSMGVLMLTANVDVFDRIVGLEVGADDYITKPFVLEEVVARVRSVLHRIERQTMAVNGAGRAKQMQLGRFLLDEAQKQLVSEGGEVVRLGDAELSLLRAFQAHPNEVLSRGQLLELTGDTEADNFDRAIDVRITRLRRKIEDDPAKPQVIKTIRGAGYKYISP